MTCKKNLTAGDVVYKKGGAGFTGAPAFGVLTDDGSEDWNCVWSDRPDHDGQPNCREWATVRLVDASSFEQAKEKATLGEFVGSAYHVSECEMETE